ncbi:alpha-galactosidase [Streptomyces sp. NBC_00448]|uniref:alpha-galactosidase n=1 Tax=Streptomyces sp. NBC_00448 TaxID=2903652 RepID=UPI002E234E87
MAEFADPARLWVDGDALRVRGAVVSLLTDGARLGIEDAGAQEAGTQGAESATVLHLRAETAATTVLRLDVPLGDASGYWHPGAGWDRHLVADWANPWRTVGLVDSAPLGCLYDAAGRTLLAFGSDRLAATTRLRFGVGEEAGRFGVWLAMDLRAGESCRIRLQAPGRPWAESVRALTRALPDVGALPTPDAARTPAYSTWYAMHRQVTAAGVEAEAERAAAAGCGVLLLDDGWQLHAEGAGYSGSGDWHPDPAKFPDFAAHVKTVQGMGLRYVAWIAPLLIGERTAAHREMAEVAPHAIERLGCRVLDPRRPAARRFAVDSCVELVRRYGLDGLKIDFLDFATAYAGRDGERAGRDDGAGAGGGASTDAGTGVATDAGTDPGTEPDVATGTATDPDAEAGTSAEPGTDVGLAMRQLLTELRDRLRELRGDDLLVELRQPYTGPGMHGFGNLLRAADCPADATANRVRTLDVGVLAGTAAVHSDMLMWDPGATARAAARQLHSALFATPQISVELAGLSTEHHAMTVFWLGFWRTHRDVLTRGEIRTGRPDLLHQTVTASLGRRAVIAFYAEHRVAPVRLAGRSEVALVNSTATAHVALDVEGPGVRVRLDTFDACGRPAGSGPRTLGPGLTRIAVPPSGLCVVTPEPPQSPQSSHSPDPSPR